ncbi:MAG: nuclear transport factor 2 family protein [Pyrinomonadaceae bacterium]
MKRLISVTLLAAASLWISACGGPAANNAPATTTNSNGTKPTAAAPTVDALIAMEKAANEAWVKGDTKHFETMLDDKFVSYEGGTRMTKADMLKMIASNKCEVKEGWKLEDPQMAKINDDTYAMSYKTTMEGTCTYEGKSMKIPTPTRAATVWIRNGEKWNGVFHAENMIIDPKAAPAGPAAPPAKAEPKKDEAKKEEPKKEEPKKDDKAAANSNTAAAPAPAKPTPSVNTEALVKSHTAGWEAFKARDAKYFEGNLTSGFAFVDPIGGWHGTKADAIKTWTETMKCEGVTKVGVTDGFSTAISPTVELLTLKGTADGKCDGQPNGPLFQTAFYVKEGDAWKLAFMFESIPMPGA